MPDTRIGRILYLAASLRAIWNLSSGICHLQIYRVDVDSDPCTFVAQRACHESEGESSPCEISSLDEPPIAVSHGCWAEHPCIIPDSFNDRITNRYGAVDLKCDQLAVWREHQRATLRHEVIEEWAGSP